jgi:hypothetical protein
LNHDFQAHVTSQAFVLSLSRPMIDLLERIAKHPRGTDEWCAYLNPFYALRRRGLIDVKDGKARITHEGGLVLELCACAGLAGRQKLKAAA